METLWRKCLDVIEKQILPENFTTWFSPTYAYASDDGSLTIAVPNAFFRDCLTENYQGLIESALESITNKKISVLFFIDSKAEEKISHEVDSSKIEIGRGKKGNGHLPSLSLNTNYTFSSFVVGGSNQFAHAACQAVSANTGSGYNPLFIYGSVGLGKTHLLHAIGHEIIKTNPGARVRYISAEGFTIDMINSIRKDKMPEFRSRYRPLDVLLVDDIQFLAGKERTQEEFFYTFNALYESHKQLVLSSDQFPKDMHKIEERLRSRLGWGLIADIKPPDLETKIAILLKKSEKQNVSLPQDVATFIASNIKSNIRELEGFLIRIIAFSSFTRRKIDMELAKEVLKEITYDQKKNFTLPTIIKTTASFFNIKISDLKSKKRNREISVPRQIAMYLCREHTSASLPEIGKYFGGKDHTTVIFSYKKISRLLNENNEISQNVKQISALIESA